MCYTHGGLKADIWPFREEYLTLKYGPLLEVNCLRGQKREPEEERDSILISRKKYWLLKRVCIRKPIQIFI